MKEPLISVVLPVYNSKEFISESINSILKQSITDFELIIVNDGSTDETYEICKKFSEIDNRVILINNQHKGLTISLNDGIKLSKGKYIARQDADDFSHNNRFEEQLKWFSKKKNRILCGTDANIIQDNKKNKKNWIISFNHKNIVKKLEYSNCFIHSSTMFLKEKVIEAGLYDEKLQFSQDYDLWWRLSELGEIGNIKKKLVSLRIQSNSVSSQKSEEQAEDFILSCMKYYAYKKNLINIKKNYKINFYENNIITRDYLIILRYLYNDKLRLKIYLKDLKFKHILKIIFLPLPLIRKILKNLKSK